MTEQIDEQAGRRFPGEPEDESGHENAEASVSEWMQIMLEEMERKRDEQEEAREELEQRTEDAPKSASRTGPAGRRKGAA